MTLRVAYYSPKTTVRGETARIKRDYIQRTANLLILPRQEERDREAMAVAPVDFYLYRRVGRQGRRCTCCYPGPEVSAKRDCPNCFGTGIVPGYQKYGTKTEIIEPSRANVTCVNVMPNWAASLRPVAFSLLETATQGYVECSIPITNNIGVIDHLSISADLDQGAKTTAYVRSPSDSDWVEMTEVAIRSRLNQPYIRFRIYLTRKSPKDYIPSLLNLYFRYQLKSPIVQANIPRITEAETLADIGIEDSIGTMTLWFIKPISHVIGKQDFLRKLSDGTLWKVIDIQRFDPLDGKPFSADVTARFVQSYEMYHSVHE